MRTTTYSMPERKEVTARIERMKREQAEQDQKLQQQRRQAEQPAHQSAGKN
jgi:hypothetical protein